MSVALLARWSQLLFAVFLTASAIVMVDDSGVFGDQEALASTAEAIRGVGSGELAGGLEGFGDIKDAVRRITDSFNELGRALDG